ncbi:MAG: methyltransferase domain-containing protein [Candidatus Cloacimonetes bacterium]|nr:methyltransferase domain-containing protein [Candidatus Cloacimonadota bacterium]
MAIPIINDWEKFFSNPYEGLGSSYERIILNDLLFQTVNNYNVHKVLESPSFGFTGISGINLLNLAELGLDITLEDNDLHRLKLIENLWNKLGYKVNLVYNPEFIKLDYPDKSFDMSFSFSALWFVSDLANFLKELSRVTAQVIFISVPNRDGIGFKLQMKDYSPEKYPQIKLSYIDLSSIIYILKKFNWNLVDSGYFDCPPWPDIGMTKEELLKKWFPQLPITKIFKEKPDEEPSSILDYYSGKDSDFAQRMHRYQWLEKTAPISFKKIWAHHYYMIFAP